jgi:heme oxygenase
MSLKELTHNNHVAAEAHVFTKLLVSTNMSKEIYGDYLFNQTIAYNALESLASLNTIEDVARTSSMQEDLKELGVESISVKVYPATVKYVEHLKTLSKQNLMAHVYVRHMGDMYGGQVIKTKIPGSGTMYNFENRSNLIKSLRMQLSDDMAPEANKCFSLILELFTELADEHNIQ